MRFSIIFFSPFQGHSAQLHDNNGRFTRSASRNRGRSWTTRVGRGEEFLDFTIRRKQKVMDFEIRPVFLTFRLFFVWFSGNWRRLRTRFLKFYRLQKEIFLRMKPLLKCCRHLRLWLMKFLKSKLLQRYGIFHDVAKDFLIGFHPAPDVVDKANLAPLALNRSASAKKYAWKQCIQQ